MVFKIAWRNIWRNKRRTFITAAAILIAVFMSILMQSIQVGMWDNMINSVVNIYHGPAQIRAKDYTDYTALDKAFEQSALESITKIDGVEHLVPRLQGGVLLSSEEQSRVGMLIGVDPEREASLTKLNEKITKGIYLQTGEQGLLLGDRLAELLGVDIGDTLVLLGQGYHGVNAAGKFPIRGLLHFGSPELNKSIMYMSLTEAQSFFSAEGFISSCLLELESFSAAEEVVDKANLQLAEGPLQALVWSELIPDLMQARELDTTSGMLILWVLYVIITFGIFGTILMMTKERNYEFGVLISIGMSRYKLMLTTWIEIVFMAFVGVMLGALLAFPLIYWLYTTPVEITGEAARAYEQFGVEPLVRSTVDLAIFIEQGIKVFFISTLLACYPFIKIWSMKPVEAMRA